MKTKTVEEKKKALDEKIEALKKKKELLLKREKAREAKATAAEKLKLRKQDTHIKIMLGVYLLAEIKKVNDKALLEKIAGTLKSEKEKQLILNLLPVTK